MTDTTPLATITGQNEITEPGADGRLQPGYRVSFQTAKGVVGTVFVPKLGYSKATVLAAVKEAATVLDSIHGATVS